MSFSAVVTAQFRFILQEKCCGFHGNFLDGSVGQFNARCIFHLFTVILGYVLIVTVAIGQIPLLYKILRFQCGKSYISPMNIATLATTTSSYVAYAVYRNLPISTWGEGIVQLILYVIIINLMCLYHRRHRDAVIFMLLYIPVMVVLLWPLVPGYVLSGLQVASMGMHALRKMTWIYRNHKEKGQTQHSTRSAITLMNFCSFGRILTSIVDARDYLLVLFYIQESVLGTILTVQTLRYWVKRRRMKRIEQTTHEERTRPAG